MVSVIDGGSSGNETLDSNHVLWFPLRDANGNSNVARVTVRASATSHHATAAVSPASSVGVAGSGTHDAGNGNIQEDPVARAREKATGPIPRALGPVPNSPFSIPDHTDSMSRMVGRDIPVVAYGVHGANPAGKDRCEFLATEDPAVRVSAHPPHPLCDVFGHQWHLFPYPMCKVFNPETGVHLMDTYRAICSRCPVTVLVERKPEPVNNGQGCPLCGGACDG